MTRAARLAGRRSRSTSTCTRAPKRRRTPRSAVRVGFRPTSSISMREPGRAAAATSQKAADEKSPGTTSVRPCRRWPPVTETVRPSTRDVAAERRQRPLRVVARRGRLGDAGRAVGVQAGEQHGALDLGARHRRAGARWRAARVPWIVSGGWPSVASMRAPIRSSGSITRRIGRRDSDASPISVAVNGWPARTPASRRIVVPELPASSGPAGERSCPKPRPSRVTVPSARSSTSTPSPRRQASVERQSAPGAK